MESRRQRVERAQRKAARQAKRREEHIQRTTTEARARARQKREQRSKRNAALVRARVVQLSSAQLRTMEVRRKKTKTKQQQLQARASSCTPTSTRSGAKTPGRRAQPGSMVIVHAASKQNHRERRARGSTGPWLNGRPPRQRRSADVPRTTSPSPAKMTSPRRASPSRSPNHGGGRQGNGTPMYLSQI